MRYNAIYLTLVIVFEITGSGLAVADDLGEFTVTMTCQAVKSINSGSNPGKVKVTTGKTYPAISLNKPNGNFLKLRINGAKPSERWVRLDCGTLADGSTTNTTSSSRDNLLGLS